MKRAVQYGAGNIGRGFIAQLFAMSGYETVFIDVDPIVVEALNARGRYEIELVDDTGGRKVEVAPVRAVDGRNADAAAAEIAAADLMATAVGVNVLPKIAGIIAQGLERRWEGGDVSPFNIIVCENLLDAGGHLASLVETELAPGPRASLRQRVGFVEASIGRMVPTPDAAARARDPLHIRVEPYDRLPVDRDGFVGPIPPLANMAPYAPFRFHIERKLFIHNLGHAAVAYFGAKKGHEFIWQAVGDADVGAAARAAMLEAARALSAEHGVPFGEIAVFADELLARFANRGLGDSVERVGRDLTRKLGAHDRLAGALQLCAKHGLRSDAIRAALAAAFAFRDPASPSRFAALVADGPERALRELCGLGEADVEAVLALIQEPAAGP